MSTQSPAYQLRVGVFGLIGLVLLGILLLQFSKGGSFFAPTYELQLITLNVGGIKPQASVLMAGVPVGRVVATELNSNNKYVTIRLHIFQRHAIRRNSIFNIDQSGFLGDQFVSITPGVLAAPPLIDGQVVRCEQAFNLQDAARSAMDLIHDLKKAISSIDQLIGQVRNELLTEKSLSDLATGLANIRRLSEQATNVMSEVDYLLQTNMAPITTALHDLPVLTGEAKKLSGQLNDMVASNQLGMSATITNLEALTRQANLLLVDARAGKGPLGKLLIDPDVDQKFTVVVSNMAVLSSNLVRYGLLYKPKPEKKPAPTPGQRRIK